MRAARAGGLGGAARAEGLGGAARAGGLGTGRPGRLRAGRSRALGAGRGGFGALPAARTGRCLGAGRAGGRAAVRARRLLGLLGSRRGLRRGAVPALAREERAAERGVAGGALEVEDVLGAERGVGLEAGEVLERAFAWLRLGLARRFSFGRPLALSHRIDKHADPGAARARAEWAAVYGFAATRVKRIGKTSGPARTR